MRKYESWGWWDDETKRWGHCSIEQSMDEPATGVVQKSTAPEWWFEDSGGSIDLGYEEAVAELRREKPGFDDEGIDDELIGFESQGPFLHGDWTKDREGRYEPSDGEVGYSAIEREDVIQVILSKTTKRGYPCSPCYPGQVDLDTDGAMLAYSLPEE